MKVQLSGGYLFVHPRYGGRLYFPFRTRWQRFKFIWWYVKYLLLWKDPISHVNDKPYSDAWTKKL